jgi:transcription elongation GreA/GreB family factor
VAAPLGRAVLVRRAGDLVDVASPAGRYRARILAVERAGLLVGQEVAA